EDVEIAFGQQGNADHRDEQRDVFGEESSASFCDRGFGRRLLRRVRTCVLTHVFSIHEWITCGHPVPAERLQPDDQTRSVWCRTPRTLWQSPSLVRRQAQVRTKRLSECPGFVSCLSDAARLPSRQQPAFRCPSG